MKKKAILTLNYNRYEGVVLPDGLVEDYVFDRIKTHKKGIYQELCIGSENIILAFRVSVREGMISPREIVIQFKGEELQLTEQGRLTHWPDGFCDVNEKLLFRLL